MRRNTPDSYHHGLRNHRGNRSNQAFVRWVAGEEFGLTFESIAPDQLKRLEMTIQHLPYVPDQTGTLIDEPAKQAWMHPDLFGQSKL